MADTKKKFYTEIDLWSFFTIEKTHELTFQVENNSYRYKQRMREKILDFSPGFTVNPVGMLRKYELTF